MTQALVMILGQLAADLLYLAANGASGLSILVAIGLCAGRKGHADCYLSSGRMLLKLAFILGILGAFYFFWAYLLQVLPYGNNFYVVWQPFFEAPGLPWSSSLTVWIIGTALIFLAKSFLPHSTSDRYSLSDIKFSLAFCCLAGLCSFASYCLVNWPFGGLPAGLEIDQAILAIFRNAGSRFFMGLGVGGGIALAFYKNYQSNCRYLILRWLAIGATLCYLPHLLRMYSVFLGMSVSGKTYGAMSLHFSALSAMLCASGAVCCWIMMAAKKGNNDYLRKTGFLFLILEAAMPAIHSLFNYFKTL